MASPRTVTVVALSVALGLFFVFMGTIKLTPRLSKDAYTEMVSEAKGWRGTHPPGTTSTSPLLSFPVHGPVPLTPTPHPRPHPLPNNFAASEVQLDKSDFICRLCWEQLFWSHWMPVGGGVAQRVHPHLQVNQKAETCVTPVIGRNPSHLLAHPKSGQAVCKSDSFPWS